MKLFKINDKIQVVCTTENTRYGFRHLATLFVDGDERETDKACYYNRTWEKYEFQSVLKSIVEKAFKNKLLSNDERIECNTFVEKGCNSDIGTFKSLAMVAKMGEIIEDNTKAKNDWKLRMIKAGLEDKGLNVPKDWDELDEKTKEERLNKVIGVLSEK